MRTPPQLPRSPNDSRIASLTSLSCLALLALSSVSAAQSTALPTGWVPFDGMTPSPASPALEILSSTSPDTVFRFAVPQACPVPLVVYDLAGRRVRTLVDGPVPAGWQTATWDGRTDRGERVASGVYFCRLEVGTRSLSRKVVVLK